MSGQSYQALSDALRQALTAVLNPRQDDDFYVWIQDFDDDTVIFSTNGGQSFSLGYTSDPDGMISLAGERPTPVTPVTSWQPTQDSDAKPVMETRGAAIHMRSPHPQLQVISEPLTYRQDTPHSYFRDLILSEHRQDLDARGRLDRHEREVKVRAEEYHRRAVSALRQANVGMESRANPTATLSNFGVPAWLIEQFATVPRPHRVLTAMIPGLPLPAGVKSISLPRLLTGGSSSEQDELTGANQVDMTDAATTSPVATFAGKQDVALQLIEQSPPGPHLDWAVFRDLTESYDHQVETALLIGDGAGDHLLGLANIPGITAVTDSTTLTGASMWTDLSKLIGGTSSARNLPVEAVLIRSGRWAWMGAQGDSQNRPLITPGDSPDPGLAREDGMMPLGSVFGPLAWADESLPVTWGSGGVGRGTQDLIIACRPSDMLLLEGQPRTTVAVEVLSGTLSARLQLRNYAAAFTARYPSGIGTLTGSAYAYPAGY